VRGEFHDVLWVFVFFNMDDAILDGRQCVSKDGDCFHFGVCQVGGVQVPGGLIGLELVTPIEVCIRCYARIKEPAPRCSVSNVLIGLPNWCSIGSVRDSDTGMRFFFDLPSARVFNNWL